MSRQAVPYIWPEGKTCAVVFSADVDGESPYLWQQRGKKLSAIGELELRRFGPRVGVHRIMDLLDEFGAKGSFYVPGYIAERYPNLMPTLQQHGHELGLHGYHHELVHLISDDENRRILERCLAIFEQQVGLSKPGYRSPAWELTPAVHQLLCEYELPYDSSLMGFDHPYSVAGLTEVPVQWTTDDAIYFRFFGGGKDQWHPANPGSVLDSWIEEFEGIREYNGLFMITIHPWISGRAQRIRMLRDLFQHISQYDDVWWTTTAEVARYHAGSVNTAHFEVPVQLANTDF